MWQNITNQNFIKSFHWENMYDVIINRHMNKYMMYHL